MSANTIGPASPDALVERLIARSVGKGHDAFTDVDWDEPLDRADPRLAIGPWHQIGASDWYADADGALRAEVGLRLFATSMRIGWQFENLLQQGLLIRAFRMDNDDPSFRYVHHEIVEESQHSMMFHEFCRRHVPDAKGMHPFHRAAGSVVVPLVARFFPELFFVFVLGGELPIDTQQRGLLRQPDLHPLVRRITSIHVEEESRHVSFANHQLRTRAPHLGRIKRVLLAVLAPLVLNDMVRMMVVPRRWVLEGAGVDPAHARATRRSPATRQAKRDSVARLRRLFTTLDLTPRYAVATWRAVGLWEDPARA